MAKKKPKTLDGYYSIQEACKRLGVDSIYLRSLKLGVKVVDGYFFYKKTTVENERQNSN